MLRTPKSLHGNPFQLAEPFSDAYASEKRSRKIARGLGGGGAPSRRKAFTEKIGYLNQDVHAGYAEGEAMGVGRGLCPLLAEAFSGTSSPKILQGKKETGVGRGRPSDNSSLCFIIITNASFVK